MKYAMQCFLGKKSLNEVLNESSGILEISKIPGYFLGNKSAILQHENRAVSAVSRMPSMRHLGRRGIEVILNQGKPNHSYMHCEMDG